MKKYVSIKGKMFKAKAELADTLNRKLAGLILETKTYPLLFSFDYERKWGFHTFLVLKPLDFVFIDKEKRVVEVKYRVKPFKFCIRPSKPAKYVLELPEGMGSLVKIGEKLKF